MFPASNLLLLSCLIWLFSSLFYFLFFRLCLPFFDVELIFFIHYIFSWVVCSMPGFYIDCTAYLAHRMYLILTCADLTFYLCLGRGYTTVSCMCVTRLCFVSAEGFFHSRVIEACPATTECIVLWRCVHVWTTTTTRRLPAKPQHLSLPQKLMCLSSRGSKLATDALYVRRMMSMTGIW